MGDLFDKNEARRLFFRMNHQKISPRYHERSDNGAFPILFSPYHKISEKGCEKTFAKRAMRRFRGEQKERSKKMAARVQSFFASGNDSLLKSLSPNSIEHLAKN